MRILILGGCGAGKSTFAQSIGESIDIPIYHLDALYWKAGWKRPTKEEWDSKLSEIVNKDEWIIDGEYRDTLDERLEKADVIIFLDVPTVVRLYRVIKRRVIYSRKKRPDMHKDCEERLNKEFIRDVIRFNRHMRKKIINKVTEYQNTKEVIIMSSNNEMKSCLDSLVMKTEHKNNRCVETKI